MKKKLSAKKKSKYQLTPEELKQVAIAKLFLKKLDKALTDKASQT